MEIGKHLSNVQSTVHSTVQATLQINPVKQFLHSGKQPRKITRQNSRLAWDCPVTAPFIKLDLVIECRQLPKKDSFCQADAFCALWEAPRADGKKKVDKLPAKFEKEVGRTEVVRGNRDPRFSSTFRLNYLFHEQQTFIIRVYNEDLRYATDLKEHDYIGGCIFTLGQLMGAGGCTITRQLHRGKAFVILTGQEIIESKEVLEFRFSGQDLGLLERKKKQKGLAKEVLKHIDHLAKDVLDGVNKLNVPKNLLEKFDAYFLLERLNLEDQTWKTVWKSEVLRDNQNPTWNAARIPLQLLCDDDPTNPIRIAVWDWNRFIPDEMAGFVETTVEDLVQKSKRGIPVFDVMCEKKKFFGGKKLKKAGTLKVLKANIVNIPSMMQYMAGGCRMDLMFAIDCTVHNKDWRDDRSLHFHSSTWLNDYQAVINKIATVFESFEGMHDFTMWGYGGLIEGAAQPYFSMGDNLKSADALIKAYDQTFSDENDCLALGKTAELRHVIQAAMYRSIQLSQGCQCYSTLVILTAGAIADVQSCIDVVCTAAEDAPLSIVIIGVGNGNFEDMERLLGDESGKLKHSNGVPIARGIVQFVTMADCQGNASRCVGEALREVPEQFVQHFTNAGIKPMPPKAVPDIAREHDCSSRNSQASPRSQRSSGSRKKKERS